MLSFLMKNNILKEVEINGFDFIIAEKFGDYKKFSFINCISNDYATIKGHIVSGIDYSYDKLMNGDVIEIGDKLIFSTSSELGIKYMTYIYDYLGSLEELELEVFKNSIQKTDYIRINAYIKMYKEGSISKNTLSALIGDKVYDLNLVS